MSDRWNTFAQTGPEILNNLLEEHVGFERRGLGQSSNWEVLLPNDESTITIRALVESLCMYAKDGFFATHDDTRRIEVGMIIASTDAAVASYMSMQAQEAR